MIYQKLILEFHRCTLLFLVFVCKLPRRSIHLKLCSTILLFLYSILCLRFLVLTCDHDSIPSLFLFPFHMKVPLLRNIGQGNAEYSINPEQGMKKATRLSNYCARLSKQFRSSQPRSNVQYSKLVLLPPLSTSQ